MDPILIRAIGFLCCWQLVHWPHEQAKGGEMDRKEVMVMFNAKQRNGASAGSKSEAAAASGIRLESVDLRLRVAPVGEPCDDGSST